MVNDQKRRERASSNLTPLHVLRRGAAVGHSEDIMLQIRTNRSLSGTALSCFPLDVNASAWSAERVQVLKIQGILIN